MSDGLSGLVAIIVALIGSLTAFFTSNTKVESAKTDIAKNFTYTKEEFAKLASSSDVLNEEITSLTKRITMLEQQLKELSLVVEEGRPAGIPNENLLLKLGSATYGENFKVRTKMKDSRGSMRWNVYYGNVTKEYALNKEYSRLTGVLFRNYDNRQSVQSKNYFATPSLSWSVDGLEHIEVIRALKDDPFVIDIDLTDIDTLCVRVKTNFTDSTLSDSGSVVGGIENFNLIK